MRALAVDAYGDEPRVMEVPPPTAGDAQILVRVAAAGLNPFDVAIYSGAMRDSIRAVFPLIIGIDVAGTVEQVGAGVTRFAVGDRVSGAVFKVPAGSTGTLAELVALDEGAAVVHTPKSVDAAMAAALPTSAAAAVTVLDAAGELAGRTVVVVGASGGVGSFVTQLAAGRGAHVVATASQAAAGRLLAHGAAEIVDHRAGPLASQLQDRLAGIDVYVHLVRNSSALAEIAAMVRPAGHVVSTVGGVELESLEARGVHGVNINTRQTPQLQARVLELVDGGQLTVAGLHRISLDQAPAALAEIAQGRADSKTVVVL